MEKKLETKAKDEVKKMVQGLLKENLDDILAEKNMKCVLRDNEVESQESELNIRRPRDATERRFIAFDTTQEAKDYVRSISNYNELNLFDFKTQTRRELQFMVEPLHQQLSTEKGKMFIFDQKLQRMAN